MAPSAPPGSATAGDGERVRDGVGVGCKGGSELPCDLFYGAFDVTYPLLLDRTMDRRLGKHYLPATSFAEGNLLVTEGCSPSPNSL